MASYATAYVGPMNFVLHRGPDPRTGKGYFMGFSLGLNSDECEGGCSYKRGRAAAMRPVCRISLDTCVRVLQGVADRHRPGSDAAAADAQRSGHGREHVFTFLFLSRFKI